MIAPTYRLLTRQRTPISVRFRLRPPKIAGCYGNPHPLQIRIIVDGQEDPGVGYYADGQRLEVNPALWSQAQQRRTDRQGTLFNFELDRIRTAIMAVYQRQRQAGMQPTTLSVKTEFLTGEAFEKRTGALLPNNQTLLGGLDRLLASLQIKVQSGQMEAKTLRIYHRTRSLTAAFLQTRRRADLPLRHLNVEVGEDFRDYLVSQANLSPTVAFRHFRRLSLAVDGLVKRNALAKNPLRDVDISQGAAKEIYWLDEPQQERFWALGLAPDSSLYSAWWWFGVMLLTGLDYVDAIRYVENPALFEKDTPGGRLIAIRRSKSPCNDCAIPILPELTILLTTRPARAPLSLQKVNNYLKVLQEPIGFEPELTTKLARKTAGSLFLLRGYSLESVSRILGHSNLQTTLRYYVKITQQIVIRDMQRVEKQKGGEQ